MTVEGSLHPAKGSVRSTGSCYDARGVFAEGGKHVVHPFELLEILHCVPCLHQRCPPILARKKGRWVPKWHWGLLGSKS